MKKVVFLGMVVVLIVGSLALGQVQPTRAGSDVVYETVLVPKLQNVLSTGVYTSVEIDEGEVKVYSDGGYKVEIKGLKLNGQLYAGNLGVILWDIEYSGGKWQRQSGEYAATPATINLEEGEGTLKVSGDSEGSISSGDHSGFVAQVTDPGVAWLLMSGFSVSE